MMWLIAPAILAALVLGWWVLNTPPTRDETERNRLIRYSQLLRTDRELAAALGREPSVAEVWAATPPRGR